MTKKKHQLTEIEYEIYQKIHQYDEPVETEEGKIKRELHNTREQRRKSERKLNAFLDALQEGSADADANEDEWDEHELAARRELGNAKTHKQRLKSIKKFEDEE